MPFTRLGTSFSTSRYWASALVAAFWLSHFTAAVAGPKCSGNPSQRPPECNQEGGEQFDANFVAGTFQLNPSPLRFIKQDAGHAASDSAVTLYGLDGDWYTALGVCSEVLMPIPASVNVPKGKTSLQASVDVIQMTFDGILVATVNGPAELTIALQGNDPGNSEIRFGLDAADYTFTEIGVFARMAKGSGSRKRCQGKHEIPAALSTLRISPVSP